MQPKLKSNFIYILLMQIRNLHDRLISYFLTVWISIGCHLWYQVKEQNSQTLKAALPWQLLIAAIKLCIHKKWSEKCIECGRSIFTAKSDFSFTFFGSNFLFIAIGGMQYVIEKKRIDCKKGSSSFDLNYKKINVVIRNWPWKCA